ncbi:cysteine dioxygenase family protein [Pelagibius sp. Alg239-R121]|uniref:cysteine dioxygenase n=1 Tax=Pelagibius sp. Alg239-R121 TaxID=2993448 RepID=UPI0024A6F6DA|nr:cysteine dioxygenase family protein [Pelagibius sp. Alg239-R121]
MSVKAQREAAIRDCISRIKRSFQGGVTVPALEVAKHHLMSLCEQRALFPRSDFPVPNEVEIERTSLIYQDEDGGYALYVNSSRPGQTSRPHDHGGSWALVAAVEGEETHRLYVHDGSDVGGLRQVTELTVQPGLAVSLMPGGIHAIEAKSSEPLLHLHLYGLGFPQQGKRREFDQETGQVHRFHLKDLGFIEDAR